MQPKVRRRELIKIRTEINGIEKGNNNRENQHRTISWFLKMSTKLSSLYFSQTDQDKKERRLKILKSENKRAHYN